MKCHHCGRELQPGAFKRESVKVGESKRFKDAPVGTSWYDKHIFREVTVCREGCGVPDETYWKSAEGEAHFKRMIEEQAQLKAKMEADKETWDNMTTAERLKKHAELASVVLIVGSPLWLFLYFLLKDLLT